MKTETTSYGHQGQVKQNGHVQQHVHVHHKPPTAAPYTVSAKPLKYNNLVDMYISGRPGHYARQAADTKSSEIQNAPQVHRLTSYPPRAPSPPVAGHPAVAPAPPQPQALPQIKLAPPQPPPRPQALPVIQSYQQPARQPAPQPPLALPQKQPVPQQAYSPPQQQQPIQLVAQSIPVQPNIPQRPQPQQVQQVQQNPNLNNRITLNSRFPVAGHQNTKRADNVNSQNLVSNNSPGLNPRGARGRLGLRANQVRRLQGGAQQRGRMPRRQNGHGPNGRGMNRKLMDERRRRLAQWQQYLRQSKNRQNHLNEIRGGDDKPTTAQRRRRFFNRRRFQKSAPEGQAKDIVIDDTPNENSTDEYAGEISENAKDVEEGDAENQQDEDDEFSDDEYADITNYIADDQANNVYEDDFYDDVNLSNEAEASDILNSVLYSREKRNNDDNSVEVQLASSNENLERGDKSQLFVINNAPEDVPANLPK